MRRAGTPVLPKFGTHHIIVSAPPGSGKTKIMAEMLARYKSVAEKGSYIDGFSHDIPQANVPALCVLLFCLLVEPEFQEDRLADYQERFADLWVPKFGRRAVVVVYVWHVLRQSRFIDWLIRTIRPFE